MIETTYINIYAAPGSGKSTVAAEIFVQLKKAQGLSVELVTEVAKDFVWEGREKTLENQPYVDMKQYRNLKRLQGKVDFVVTDSPILKGIIYAARYTNLPDKYSTFLRWLHMDLGPSINILIERDFDYDEIGRLQDKSQAEDIQLLFKTLTTYDIVSKTSEASERFMVKYYEKYKAKSD
jgi:hypothetical protein